MRNWFFSVADSTKLTTLLEWDNEDNFAWALTVWGWAAIPRFLRDWSPYSVIPNCWRVLDKATWNELDLCDCEYTMILIITIVRSLLSCLRSVDIRSEHLASLMQPYRFAAPASLHIFSKAEGSISGCGKWAIWDLSLTRSSLKLGQNDAFLRSKAYSSAERKTPSIVWHSFSSKLGLSWTWVSILTVWLGELKVIVVVSLAWLYTSCWFWRSGEFCELPLPARSPLDVIASSDWPRLLFDCSVGSRYSVEVEHSVSTNCTIYCRGAGHWCRQNYPQSEVDKRVCTHTFTIIITLSILFACIAW